MGEIRNAYNTLVGKPEGKNHLEDLGIDGKIILEWVLMIYGGVVWNGCIWLRIGSSGGLLQTQ
jgi:hypothetical protein